MSGLGRRPFGQREKLTRRLKRILTGYPFDKEVLKELVQNADDAGASKIVFIADPRQLPVYECEGKQWDTLQGPSLCVYNDKPFTKADIEGIQNLGEGAKGNDPTKTGQYGVGFNAVYHFTETPTFVSSGPEIGEILCALDPHHKYVPGATVDSPGCMFENLRELKRRFPGIIDGYIGNVFSLEDATMFRFPLRTGAQSADSQIARSVVTVQHMKDLLERLKDDMLECLLFLNNLTTIEVGELDEAGRYHVNYWVQTVLSDEDERSRNAFLQHITRNAEMLKKGQASIHSVASLDVTYQMILEDSTRRMDSWLVMQHFGYDDPSKVPQDVRDAYEKGDLGMLPRGGVALLYDSNRPHVEQAYKKDHRLFCFLPLPIKTYLPMHINGHFALDHESRRGLWQDDGTGYRTSWNELLLRHTIAPLYVRMINTMRIQRVQGGHIDNTHRQLDRYYSLFPRTPPRGNPYMTAFTRAVYKLLQNLDCLAVLHVEASGNIKVEWCKPQDCFFDNLIEQHAERNTEQNCKALADTLRNCSFPLLSRTPKSLYGCFKDVDVAVKTIDPPSVVNFLAAYKQRSQTLQDMAHQGSLPVTNTPFRSVSNVELVYKYCLGTTDLDSSNFFRNLYNMPLLLTDANNVKPFGNSILFSEYSDLAVGQGDMFLNNRLFNMLSKQKFKKYSENFQLFEKLTVRKLNGILPEPLKALFLGKTHAPIQCLISVVENPSLWLCRLWNFFAAMCEVDATNRRKVSLSTEEKLQVLMPVNDWCFVPASDQRGNILIPVKKVASVVNLNQIRGKTSNDDDVRTSLLKYGLPKPFYAAFGESFFLQGGHGHQLLQSLVTDIQKPDGIVYAIQELQHEPEYIGNMSQQEANTLMVYFGKHFESIKHVKGVVLTLQALPAYETIDGRRVSIHNMYPYVLPKGIPSDDMDSWTGQKDANGAVFLIGKTYLKDIMRFVGCKFLSVAEVYCGFIFDQFERLSAGGRLTHLGYIKDYLAQNTYITDKKSRNNLLEEIRVIESKLPSVAFLEADDGDLLPASHFYDPDIDLFLQFEDKFPPEPYDSIEWKTLMRKCGLIDSVNPDKFLGYIHRLVAMENDESFCETSRTLIMYLFRHEKLQINSLLQKVKYIPFVTPHIVSKPKRLIHQQYGQGVEKVRPVAFNNSLVSLHQNLTWTSCNLLPIELVDMLKKSGAKDKSIDATFMKLGVKQTPSNEEVVEHLENICQKLAQCSTSVLHHEVVTLEFMFSGIYGWLSGRVDSFTPVLKEKLTALPIALVIPKEGKICMVKPNRLTLHASNPHTNMPPFLQTVSKNLRKHEDLLCCFGTEESATPQQFVNILRDLKDACRSDVLEPNEREVAGQAFLGLLHSLLESTELVCKVHDLYLPSSDAHMYEAKCIIYVDNPKLKERAKAFAGPFLLPTEEFAQHDEHYITSAIKKLPDDERPALLSSLLTETLDENQTILSQGQHMFAVELESRLTDELFQQGLLRIMKHRHSHSHKFFHRQNNTPTLTMDHLIKVLSCIQVISAEKLITCLHQQTAGKMEDTDKEVDFFLKQTDNDMKEKVIAYLSNSLSREESMESCWIQIANAINTLFDDQYHGYEQHIVAILRCKIGKIDSILDGNKIKSCLIKTGHSAHSFRPQIGQFVPINMHHLLKQDIEHFQPMEIIAVEVHDPAKKKKVPTATLR